MQSGMSKNCGSGNFPPLDTPPQLPCIPDASVKRDAIVRGGGKASPVRFAHLGHAGHFIDSRPQLGDEGNSVPDFQGVNFSEMICHAPVVASQRHIARPYAGVLKVARALTQRGAPRPLIDFDVQVNGRNFEGAQVAPLSRRR